MCGNDALRRALDDASKLTSTSLYEGRLSELRSQYGHTIRIEPTPMSIFRFNCFGHAFGLTDHPRYDALVDLSQTSAALNSSEVKHMLDGGQLTILDGRQAKTGDVVLYFDGNQLTHAGRVSADQRVVSKWGGNELHSHELWEVPFGYGNIVKYISVPDVDTILSKLESRYKSK